MGIVLEGCIGGDSTSAIGSAKLRDAVVEIGEWPTAKIGRWMGCQWRMPDRGRGANVYYLSRPAVSM